MNEALLSNDPAVQDMAARAAFSRSEGLELIAAPGASFPPTQRPQQQIEGFNAATGKFKVGHGFGEISGTKLTLQNIDCSFRLSRVPDTWVYQGPLTCVDEHGAPRTVTVETTLWKSSNQ